ncbi:type I restriction endonuclease subunit R, partial [Aquiluna sp.]|nr:type I restriction endonuclease subunit R [Aquiluna sp.]
TGELDKSSRDFLESAILDYNGMFGVSYDTGSDGFENYYKDLTKRLKLRELDLVIVVNMFLTGFDATTLNTLWVDKNLRQHGLLQAFSRTNRILNRVKTYGNVVCFRDLEAQTTEAISLFGNKEAGGIVLLKPFSDYFQEYEELVGKLLERFSPGVIPGGETEQRDFINLYNSILRLTNILGSFDEFEEVRILSSAQQQDFQSTYLELRNVLQPRIDGDKESILDDIVFELELVKQVEINVDYILMLVKSLQDKSGDQDADKEIRVAIDRAVDSSFSLRSKRDLIQKFVADITLDTNIESHWTKFISEQKQMELEQIIEDEKLDTARAHVLMEQAFKTGELRLEGTAVSRMLPAVNMFAPDSEYSAQKNRVFERLAAFFERFNLLG